MHQKALHQTPPARTQPTYTLITQVQSVVKGPQLIASPNMDVTLFIILPQAALGVGRLRQSGEKHRATRGGPKEGEKDRESYREL